MPLLEVAHAGFGNMRGLAMPLPGGGHASVSRPFDKTRDGFVLGEGAGSLFLEDMDLAKARGARIYAEVVGYGSAADGWDMIQPIEGGAGSARAMKMALDRRGVPADEVDLINPHGTGTPLGDKREAEAIWTVFGDRAAGARTSLAISATKSMTGHMMGAAGAFEAFATVMSVAEQCVPPTINYREPDPECDLWVLTDADAAQGPLRDVEQHRPRRPQRRGHLQALRRRLTARRSPAREHDAGKTSVVSSMPVGASARQADDPCVEGGAAMRSVRCPSGHQPSVGLGSRPSAVPADVGVPVRWADRPELVEAVEPEDRDDRRHLLEADPRRQPVLEPADRRLVDSAERLERRAGSDPGRPGPASWCGRSARGPAASSGQDALVVYGMSEVDQLAPFAATHRPRARGARGSATAGATVV